MVAGFFLGGQLDTESVSRSQDLEIGNGKYLRKESFVQRR